MTWLSNITWPMTSRDHVTLKGAVRQYGRLSQRQLGFLFYLTTASMHKWLTNFWFSLVFYPRDAMLARVIVIATCLSVPLSVTRWYCVKTKKASGMISSPSGSPKTLVFWRQISSPNSKRFPEGASNKGRSEKFSDFLALSVDISKTVADTAKVTISD